MSMPEALTEYVNRWCNTHGWTDLFIERYEYWAFPPGGVMPTPIPGSVMEAFAESQAQRSTWAYGSTLFVALVAAITSYWQQSPMPLTCGFCVGTMLVAFFEDGL